MGESWNFFLQVTDHARCCVTCDFITTYQTSSAVIQAFETDQFRKRFQRKADSFSRTERYKPKCGYPSSNIAPSLNNPIKRERLRLKKTPKHLCQIKFISLNLQFVGRFTRSELVINSWLNLLVSELWNIKFPLLCGSNCATFQFGIIHDDRIAWSPMWFLCKTVISFCSNHRHLNELVSFGARTK